MTDLQLLVGSLSNDLFRISSLEQRGSKAAAHRFLVEAKRWSVPLEQSVQKKYIQRIAHEVTITEELGIEKAETFLMYGILLQNYALHSL